MRKKLLYIFLTLILMLTLAPSSVSAASKSVVYPRTKLKDVYVNGKSFLYAPQGSQVWNKNHLFFKDKSGNLSLFSYKGGNKPRVYSFDENYNVTSDMVLNLPSHDILGTFAVASDGDYYVVLGHNNTGEKAGKVVVTLLKVSSKTGEVIKKGELKGKHYGSLYSSIKKPFNAGTADLVERKDKIYIHMSYQMFKANDGINHQASNLFVFDASSLKPTGVNQKFYVSHSFNQMIKLDGSTIVTLSHGDGHPRAIRLATLDSKGNYKNTDFFKMNGSKGQNDTGTNVSGLEIGKNNYLVAGTSVTHNYPVNGKKTPKGVWYNGRNVYLTVVDKKNLSTKNIWLTTFDPTNKNITISDPRIFKAGDSYVVVYSVSENEKSSYTEFVTVNDKGEVLARNKKEKTGFYSNAYPIVNNNKIIWIAPYASRMDYYYIVNTKINKTKFEETGRVYLFEVDISNPKSPKWIEGIRPQSVDIEHKNVFLDWGNSTQLTAKVSPANTPFNDIIWSSSSSSKLKVTDDGYVTAVAGVTGGTSGEIYAMSEVDNSIYATFTIKINGREKQPTAKSMVSTPKNKQVGLYSTYECYLLEKGKQTKNVQLKNSSGIVGGYYLTSSDESIVKIKNSTIPVGIKCGLATVYFHTKDKQKITSCEVVVTPSKTDGIYITQMPKTNFDLKEPFDTTGFVAAVVSNNGRKIAFYNDRQVAFCISDLTGISNTEIWGRGRPLTQSGKIKIRVIVGGKEISYTINVGKSSNGADNSNYTKVLQDGSYNLRAMYNYLNIAADGGAELRNVTHNPVYEVKRQADGTYTLKTASGKYLGIAGEIKDGVQLKEVDLPYYWKLYSENNSDIFSLRPASNLKMLVNAAGEKNTDGTWIILRTYEDTNAPNHAEFRFIPVK